jgi:hypothetical protein
LQELQECPSSFQPTKCEIQARAVGRYSCEQGHAHYKKSIRYNDVHNCRPVKTNKKPEKIEKCPEEEKGFKMICTCSNSTGIPAQKVLPVWKNRPIPDGLVGCQVTYLQKLSCPPSVQPTKCESQKRTQFTSTCKMGQLSYKESIYDAHDNCDNYKIEKIEKKDKCPEEKGSFICTCQKDLPVQKVLGLDIDGSSSSPGDVATIHLNTGNVLGLSCWLCLASLSLALCM